MMSHELRTPLNAIAGYAELLQLGIHGTITEQQGHALGRIQASQRHLLGLIDEVLTHAKLETGTAHYQLSSVNASEAIVKAEGLVAPQAWTRGVVLTVTSCPADVFLRGDPEKVQQILLNLLSNAVKFTPRGGRIDIDCVLTDAGVRITIRDTGIGIAADMLDQIFEPFVQVRSELTRDVNGTGLGLAISRALARGMDGNLTVESDVGRGSTFTLTLPRMTEVGNG
jgi:signal transduction histidine kinase